MNGHAVTAEEYLDPQVAASLPWRDLPVLDVHDPSLREVVAVVDGDPHTHPVPVVPWPHSGGRPLDPGTGVGGGVVSGEFRCWWDGDRMMARNLAVDGHYVLGFSVPPEDATDVGGAPRHQVLLWHLNHHPDGGQLFASLDGRPFLVPVVPAGEDPDLDRAVAVRSDGTVGVCILPGVWHDGALPESGDGSFLTRQGAVHARLSCDVGAEFGCLLRVPLVG